MVQAQQLATIENDDDIRWNQEQLKDENEKQTWERSRLLSDIQDVKREKKIALSPSGYHIFLKILAMNRPEWTIILVGCVACLTSGALQSIGIVLLIEMVNAFEYCTYAQRSHQVIMIALLFLLLSVGCLFIRFIQFTAFAVAGSKLTQRVRSKAFTCLLRQEVAYFDEPENSSGALCARLSSDAMALQEMSGTRLSIIVETFSMLAFGISLGFYFSWHLTLIVCVVLPIIIAGCVLDIYLQMKVSDATGLALQCASS
ncbi:unnamed protein product, partial [Rotaria socialis]